MQTSLTCFITATNHPAIAIYPIKKNHYTAWFAEQTPVDQAWLETCEMSMDSNKICIFADAEGGIKKIVCIIDDCSSRWSLAGIVKQLPESVYEFIGLTLDEYYLAAIGWALASYKFTAYKSQVTTKAIKLVLPQNLALKALQAEVLATYLARDLVNTPAEEMDPEQLGNIATHLANQYQGKVRQIIGDDLLKENFPAIHTVGRGSARAPRLIDFRCGAENAPKITLIGKGVCFDSGGLDLKGASNMRLMKKDMGGAATVLGLAQWILALNLPIQLRVLIPAVENMVSHNAYRPGDVVKTRKGLTVEIGNTDAEGRVVLADALALACEDNPQLIIDFATLTGAARVALGPDVPNMFSNDNQLANTLQAISAEHDDLTWHMPLYKPYREFIDSSIADLSNDSAISQGGAITAALFLNEFVTPGIPWVHIDTNAWNIRTRNGRPEGGEAIGMRMISAYLQNSFKP